MKSKRLFLIGTLLCGLPLCSPAQVALKGITVRINSAFTPVSGVEILAEGGVPTLTDGTGTFILHLPHVKPGDLLFDIQIYKKGMEIVNQKEVEQWVASEDIFYKVVLCPQGYIEAARRKFYNAGKSHYQKEYDRKINELKQEQKKQQKEAQIFEEEINRINREYEKQIELLDFYVDKFARINKDELSDMEKRVIMLIEEGDINGAIQVYEQSGLINQFSRKLAQRDSIRYSLQTTVRLLKQQILWYENEKSPSSLQKSDTLKHTLKKIQERLSATSNSGR